jgi:hypothetical protein
MFYKILKKFVIYLFIWMVFFSIVNKVKADVNYETWYCPSWPCPQSSNTLLSSGTWAGGTMNYNWGSGEVLDSGRSDRVVVHLDGYITVPIPFNGSAGDSVTVTFYNQDDDGSILKIDGTTVIDDWSGLHSPSTRSGTITLQAGETYSYERWFAEWGGGAVLRQMWLVPGYHGSWTWVSATHNIATTVTSYTSAPTAAQTTLRNTLRALTHSGNGIYIDQVGDDLDLDIVQDGDNNLIAGTGTTSATIAKAEIAGDGNTIALEQKSDSNVLLFDVDGNYNNLAVSQGNDLADGGSNVATIGINGDYNDVSLAQKNSGFENGQFASISITGNDNYVASQQQDSDQMLFIDITGSDSSLTTNQKGTGNHFLDISLGSDQTLSVTQEGSGNHAATIALDGYSSSLQLNQNSSSNQTYSIDQTCANANGCGTTVVTQN